MAENTAVIYENGIMPVEDGDNPTTPDIETEFEYTQDAAVRAIKVIDAYGNVTKKNVPLVSDYEFIRVTNPNPNNTDEDKNLYSRTLKDALCAKYEESEQEIDGEIVTVRQKTGYYNYDFDTHSIVDDLNKIQTTSFQRLFGLPDTEDGDGNTVLHDATDIEYTQGWLKNKYGTIYTEDYIEGLAKTLQVSSLWQAFMEQMASFTQQLYGIPAQIVTVDELSYDLRKSEDRASLKQANLDGKTISISYPGDEPKFLGSFLNKEAIKTYWLVKEWTYFANGKTSLTGVHFATEAEAEEIMKKMKTFSLMAAILDRDIWLEDLMFSNFESTSSGDTGGAVVTKGDIDTLFNNNRTKTGGNN